AIPPMSEDCSHPSTFLGGRDLRRISPRTSGGCAISSGAYAETSPHNPTIIAFASETFPDARCCEENADLYLRPRIERFFHHRAPHGFTGRPREQLGAHDEQLLPSSPDLGLDR